MAIEKTNEIDALATEKNGKRLCLAIFDSMNWENPAEHLGLLQDKINAYISYIENRQYEESFGGKIKDFQIVIRFAEKAPEQCEKFIAVANKQLKKAKVNIVF